MRSNLSSRRNLLPTVFAAVCISIGCSGCLDTDAFKDAPKDGGGGKDGSAGSGGTPTVGGAGGAGGAEAGAAGVSGIPLTVKSTGTGKGVVKSSPEGIDCPTKCLAGFPSGTTVTLSAVPKTASAFDGFTGDCSGNACEVQMNTPRNVTASFRNVFKWARMRASLFAPSDLDHRPPALPEARL